MLRLHISLISKSTGFLSLEQGRKEVLVFICKKQFDCTIIVPGALIPPIKERLDGYFGRN